MMRWEASPISTRTRDRRAVASHRLGDEPLEVAALLGDQVARRRHAERDVGRQVERHDDVQHGELSPGAAWRAAPAVLSATVAWGEKSWGTRTWRKRLRGIAAPFARGGVQVGKQAARQASGSLPVAVFREMGTVSEVIPALDRGVSPHPTGRSAGVARPPAPRYRVLPWPAMVVSPIGFGSSRSFTRASGR